MGGETLEIFVVTFKDIQHADTFFRFPAVVLVTVA